MIPQAPLRDAFLGFDPFDALRGSRVPSFVKHNRVLRQLTIQARKRCPVDLAPFLGVTPFLMAKSLGCFLAAEARDCLRTGDTSRMSGIADLLEHDQAIARIGDAWGYEFDVQTRWAYYPANSPNLIATVFVARGFAEAGLVAGDRSLCERAHRAARYLLNNHVTEHGWCRYTPTSSVLVHNANLLGAGLFAVAGRLFDDTELVEASLRAAQVSAAAQLADGSWSYGEGESLSWCDNFHTAYNLDGLAQVWAVTRDADLRGVLDRGAAFWRDAFFDCEGAPAYFAHGSVPYDIHCAGTAMDVGARLGMLGVETGGLAHRVLEWTRANLLAEDGSTYYRKGKARVDRRHFVRWGDAHVALGRSALALAEANAMSPLEMFLSAAGDQ